MNSDTLPVDILAELTDMDLPCDCFSTDLNTNCPEPAIMAVLTATNSCTDHEGSEVDASAWILYCFRHYRRLKNGTLLCGGCSAPGVYKILEERKL